MSIEVRNTPPNTEPDSWGCFSYLALIGLILGTGICPSMETPEKYVNLIILASASLSLGTFVRNQLDPNYQDKKRAENWTIPKTCLSILVPPFGIVEGTRRATTAVVRRLTNNHEIVIRRN